MRPLYPRGKFRQAYRSPLVLCCQKLILVYFNVGDYE